MDSIIKLILGIVVAVGMFAFSLFNRVLTGICYTTGFMIAMELVGRVLK